jgi:hypothetical protein
MLGDRHSRVYTDSDWLGVATATEPPGLSFSLRFCVFDTRSAIAFDQSKVSNLGSKMQIVALKRVNKVKSSQFVNINF